MQFLGYLHALDTAGDTGHGRVRAMVWQAIHQHLVVNRRTACQDEGLNFYEVEKKAVRAVKALNVSTELSWLLVYVHTLKQAGDLDAPGIWKRSVATIGSWPD